MALETNLSKADVEGFRRLGDLPTGVPQLVDGLQLVRLQLPDGQQDVSVVSVDTALQTGEFHRVQCVTELTKPRGLCQGLRGQLPAAVGALFVSKGTALQGELLQRRGHLLLRLGGYVDDGHVRHLYTPLD